MTARKTLRIGWKVSKLSLQVASVRYRALIPLIALNHFQCHSRIFATPRAQYLKNIDLLILVKPITPSDYSLAQAAASRGIPVIYDLCDNIFIEEYKSRLGSTPSNLFLKNMSSANAVVVTTTALADVIKSLIPIDKPIYIIPDGIETPDTLREATSIVQRARNRDRVRQFLTLDKLTRIIGHLRSASLRKLATHKIAQLRQSIKQSYKKLRSNIKQSARHLHWRKLLKKLYKCYSMMRLAAPAKTAFLSSSVAPKPKARYLRCNISPGAGEETFKRILWFGNHGAEHAKFGMLDLLYIRTDIERIAKEFSVELVVVSNSFKKYEEYIKPFAIRTRYVEWSPISIEEEFKQADVVVIPNSLDAFSRCKSANRTVLALSKDIPVVATFSPALLELKKCIKLDNFYEGIKCYLSDQNLKEQHLALAKKLIREQYGQNVIGSKWRSVIDHIIHNPAPLKKSHIDLVAFLHLNSDIDLALPIITEAKKLGLSVQVWCSEHLVEKSQRTINLLVEHNWPFKIITKYLPDINRSTFSENIKNLLSIVESNLGPHEIARKITEIANDLGIYTMTIQHGFENIGLTYDDELHAAKKISFASQRIFIWGSLNSLHKNVPQATRSKCLPVGCPKMPRPTPTDIKHLIPADKPIIGVFENLHWHRYSNQYRTFFLKSIEELAISFPEVAFLVKPHNAGMWLTHRYKGDVPHARNLFIADPQAPQWAPFTAGDLLGNLSAVITTPSTVALDAARYGMPVAVVWHTLSLENYIPLFAIRNGDDWQEFVKQSLQSDSASDLTNKARQFADKSLVGNLAASKIIDYIVQLETEKQRAVK